MISREQRATAGVLAAIAGGVFVAANTGSGESPPPPNGFTQGPTGQEFSINKAAAETIDTATAAANVRRLFDGCDEAVLEDGAFYRETDEGLRTDKIGAAILAAATMGDIEDQIYVFGKICTGEPVPETSFKGTSSNYIVPGDIGEAVQVIPLPSESAPPS